MPKAVVHRTQLHLDEERYQWLRLRATVQRKSVAQVVRDLIDDDAARRMKRRKKDSLWKIVGMFKGDGSAVAENVDDYLYGGKS